jgi:hypothetical protein
MWGRRTMEAAVGELTELGVKRAGDRHAIGGGLYLKCDGRGGDKRRSWLFRYQMEGNGGRRVWGATPVGLADARQRAAEARAVSPRVLTVEARKAAQQHRSRSRRLRDRGARHRRRPGQVDNAKVRYHGSATWARPTAAPCWRDR